MQFFPRDRSCRIGWALFPIDRLTQHIHDSTEQSFAHRYWQDFAGGADFVALFEFGVVPENDDADFGCFRDSTPDR